MSFAFARKVMKMKLNPEHKNFTAVLRAQQAVAASAFTTAARVQAGLLRSQTEDDLGDFLEEIKAIEGKDLADVMA